MYRKDSFYIDLNTNERVQTTYRVYLTMPAVYDGEIEVEACSENEAIRKALEADPTDIEWAMSDCGDKHGIEVFDIECPDPPEDAILIEQSQDTSGANLHAIFEPETSLDDIAPFGQEKGSWK